MAAKVTLTANRALREEMKHHNIVLWRLADEIGMNESTLCRKLRHELEGQDKETIEGAVRRLAMAAAN